MRGDAAAHDARQRAARTAALLLHPVRMRIIQAVTGRQLTTRGLARALPDVPPATLYRHLTKLVGGGLLQVVATRRIRGAEERTYALPTPVRLSAEELAGFSREDHLRLFQAFVGGLLADHRRYLDQDSIDPHRDGVRFRQTTLALTDAEAQQLLSDLEALVRAAGQHAEPTTAAHRRRRLVTLITMPAVTGDAPPGDGRCAESDSDAASCG
jgi:DNA-binding transcriptional ArsR family regulator